MSERGLIVDFSAYSLEEVVADIREIRRLNPQRFEMEQLDAVVYDNFEDKICVGYKDVRDTEFWVRGHMPEQPLMPGVVMCEVAAQLSSFFVARHDLLGAKLVGLGGLEGIRIRGMVVPGDRLVIAIQQTKVRRGALIVCRFQGFVDQKLVIEGYIKGVPLDGAGS